MGGAGDSVRMGVLARSVFPISTAGARVGGGLYTAPGFRGGDQGFFGFLFCIRLRHGRVSGLEVMECKGRRILDML